MGEPTETLGARPCFGWSQLLGTVQARIAVLLREQDPAVVDDIVQDAMLLLWMKAANRDFPQDPVGFAVSFARRRAVDRLRVELRRPVADYVELDRMPKVDVETVPDWVGLLTHEGLPPCSGAARLLAAIAAGVKGNKSLAARLGRDVKSVREGRARLQKWLQRCLAELCPPPPQQTTSWMKQRVAARPKFQENGHETDRYAFLGRGMRSCLGWSRT